MDEGYGKMGDLSPASLARVPGVGRQQYSNLCVVKPEVHSKFHQANYIFLERLIFPRELAVP